jgi:hypothetical protein
VRIGCGAGQIYVAADEATRDAFAKGRAVFTREEMRELLESIRPLTIEQRMQVVADLIVARSAIPSARYAGMVPARSAAVEEWLRERE